MRYLLSILFSLLLFVGNAQTNQSSKSQFSILLGTSFLESGDYFIPTLTQEYRRQISKHFGLGGGLRFGHMNNKYVLKEIETVENTTLISLSPTLYFYVNPFSWLRTSIGAGLSYRYLSEISISRIENDRGRMVAIGAIDETQYTFGGQVCAEVQMMVSNRVSVVLLADCRYYADLNLSIGGFVGAVFHLK